MAIRCNVERFFFAGSLITRSPSSGKVSQRALIGGADRMSFDGDDLIGGDIEQTIGQLAESTGSRDPPSQTSLAVERVASRAEDAGGALVSVGRGAVHDPDREP